VLTKTYTDCDNCISGGFTFPPKPIQRTLNVNNIKNLEDVKRILKFLNITAYDGVIGMSYGFEEVRDLFE
jgi:hypothetical protein